MQLKATRLSFDDKESYMTVLFLFQSIAPKMNVFHLNLGDSVLQWNDECP